MFDSFKKFFGIKKKEVPVISLSKKDDVSGEGFNNKKFLQDVIAVQERTGVNKKIARKLVKQYYRSINK